jgi:hypothetical protein
MQNRALLLFVTMTLGACSDARPPAGGDASVDAGGRDGGAPPDTGAPPRAAWTLESNLSVNGTQIQDAVESAVATEVDLMPGPGYRVVLATIPEYCALLQSEGCVPNGETLVSIDIYGREPGTYSLSHEPLGEAGGFSLVWTAIDHECSGAGFGPTDGTLTITEAADGAVSIEFSAELSFVGASAGLSGTVTAPLCAL